LSFSPLFVNKACERLERANIVRQTNDAKRNRVWCANALLDILEEPAYLTRMSSN
jgi:hypothetical protein